MWIIADEKATIRQALTGTRAHLLSKLEGLDNEQARRPMTPSLTNLLGIVKHVTGVEMRICDTFGRDRALLPQEEDGELLFGGDMWARDEESIEDVVGRYHQACESVDRLVDDLDLDATGEWMGLSTTLRAALIGMIWETAAHCGHADIVRELIDGATGGVQGVPASGGHGDAYFETLKARMVGEVGPEVWERFRTPELENLEERWRAARRIRSEQET